MKPLEISPAPAPPHSSPLQREESLNDSTLAGSTPAIAPNPEIRSLSLRVNFSWTLIGNLVYAGCQWAMLVVLARLGKAEMVGQFALGLAVTAPVLMCANLNLRSLQATDARREYSFADYLSLRLAMIALALPVIAGIAFFSGYRGTTFAIVFLLGAAKSFESLSDIYYGLLQQSERMRPIAISMMIKGALSLAAMAVGLIATGSLIWATALLGAMWALIFFCYDLPQGRALLPHQAPQKSNAKVMLRLAALAAPMGLVMFLISLGGSAPRFFIEQQLGLRELGIFAAIAYLITAGGTIVGALGQSATPRLSQLFAHQRKGEFCALLWKLAALASVMGVGGLLVAFVAGGPVLRLLYGAEYSAHAALFRWLMGAAWLGYLGSVLGYALTAARRFRAQAPLYGATLLATIAGCMILIPRFGLSGAALAMTIGSVVQLAGGWAILVAALGEYSRPRNI